MSDLRGKIQSHQFQMVDVRATDHHANLYIIDDKIAIIASSNLTGRGLLERIEAGNLVTERQEVIALVQELENYFNTAHNLEFRLKKGRS